MTDEQPPVHPTLLLGSYLLRSLEHSEQHDVEEHIAGCLICRAELAELEPACAALALIDLADLDEIDFDPSHELLGRVTAALEENEHAARAPHASPARRSWPGGRRLLVAVAATAVVLAGTGVGISNWAGRTPAQHRYSATAGTVHMSVAVDGARTGTTVHLTVSGVPSDEHCTLLAIARDGSRHQAGQWVATYTGTAQFTGSTDIARNLLRQFILVGTNGNKLITVNV